MLLPEVAARPLDQTIDLEIENEDTDNVSLHYSHLPRYFHSTTLSQFWCFVCDVAGE